jgi:hypothetical protein
LGGDIVEIERIGIGLVRERCAVADDDNEPAGAQSLGEIPVRHRGRLRCTGKQHAKKSGERDNGSS